MQTTVQTMPYLRVGQTFMNLSYYIKTKHLKLIPNWKRHKFGFSVKKTFSVVFPPFAGHKNHDKTADILSLTLLIEGKKAYRALFMIYLWLFHLSGNTNLIPVLQIIKWNCFYGLFSGIIAFNKSDITNLTLMYSTLYTRILIYFLWYCYISLISIVQNCFWQLNTLKGKQKVTHTVRLLPLYV